MVKKISDSPEEKPEPGDLVVIHYEGMLEDGTIFDSSVAREEPFEFNIGESQVIDGWDMLISTMALGERATLIIPPEYAYGEEGIEGFIPPNATLTYNVELLDIGRPAEDSDEDDDSEEEEDEEATLLEDGRLFWEKDPTRSSGSGPGYAWQETGTGTEVCVSVPLSGETTLKQVKVDIRTWSLKCEIAGKSIIDAELWSEVSMDDSHWDFESKAGKPYLLMFLTKLDKGKPWEALLKGQPAHIGGGKTAKAKKGAKAAAQAEEATSSAPAAFDAEVVDVEAALRVANAAVNEGAEVVDVDP